jgi:HPt (histidine-containing phosphotransfer) domain-containing protein
MPMYQRGLTLFLKEYSELESDLLTWLAEQKFQEIKQLNHKLKGVAGNLGMRELFNATLAIEAAFYAERQQDIEKLVIELIAAVERVKPEVELLLATPNVSCVSKS